MRVSSWIAKRYFFSRKKTRFLPFLTAIAIGGVALGTCAMVVILSVMNGFREELEERLLGFTAHITITERGEEEPLTENDVRVLLASTDVAGLTPFVEGEVIIEAKLGEELFAQGARVRGVPEGDASLLRSVRYYSPEEIPPYAAIARNYGDKGMKGIILGKDILGQLNVHPDFRDTIEAIAPLADIGPTGEMEPRLKRYMLVGYFSAGVYEYDTHYALMTIDAAHELLGQQAQTGWHVRLDDPHDAPAVVAGLTGKLGGGFIVEGWHERNRKLFAALKLERYAMGGVLALVILIASFSVIGVIMMVVSSKRKDIALLKTMGMRTATVRGVFLRQGMWIGIVGASVGCLVGLIVCAGLSAWPIRLPESYYVEVLAVRVRPLWVVAVAVLGIALAMASAIYPVRRTTREEAAAVLRYE